MKKINSLTGLRFLFIVTIVLSHFSFLNDYCNNTFSLFTNGQFGVIFFFMLSGFGLTFKTQTSTSNMLNEKVTIKSSIKFGIKRISKIYLLYLVTMLLTLPLTIHKTIVSNPDDSIITSLGKVFLKLAIMPTLLQSATGSSTFTQMFNSVSWFLSTIFILYMFYPILEKFNDKIMKKKPLLWLVIILIFGEIIRFLFRSITSSFFDNLEYASPYSRIFDFITGMLICDILLSITKEKNKSLKFGHTLETIVFLLIMFTWIFVPSLTSNDLILSLSYRFVIILTIFIFSFESGFLSKLFSNNFFDTMGNLSMYIFLIHFCILLNALHWLPLLINNQLLCYVLSVLFTIIGTFIWVFIIQVFKKRKNNIRRQNLN